MTWSFAFLILAALAAGAFVLLAARLLKSFITVWRITRTVRRQPPRQGVVEGSFGEGFHPPGALDQPLELGRHSRPSAR